jgi:protein-disulfide isomerase
MLKFTRFAAAVSLVLLALTTACASSEQSQDTASAPTSPPSTAPTPSPGASQVSSPSASPTPQSDRFQDGLDTAVSAATIAQSAQSKEDWSLVVNRWQSAINLLKSVPKSSPNHATAQKKIAEYQRNLAYAQQQRNSPSKPTGATVPSPTVAVAPKQTSPSPAAATAPKQARSSPAAATAPRQANSSPVSPEVALATHLKQIRATFYGTYWCPYCNRQKEMFGSQAIRQINYVECDPQGTNPRPDLCIKAKVNSFPTWQINGQQYSGMLSLQQLADISGYKGDRNFSY